MKTFDTIGLMSGTSLDGLDVAHVRFMHDSAWQYEIIHTKSIPYPIALQSRLQKAMTSDGLALKKLDIFLGRWMGEQVKYFMDSEHFFADFIASHGHTIFHHPEEGITCQIGDGHQLATTTGLPVICDFRSLDVALGGQGAPLVPIGDRLLFSEYEMCLNLGGFSNISFENHGNRVAFDICPVNTILNWLVNKMGLQFDKDGVLARKGTLNKTLLRYLDQIPYYQTAPPKSLGVEWNEKYILPYLTKDTIENLLHTVCKHVARQIAQAIDTYFQKTTNYKPRVLVTGGGAKNKFLMETIRKEADKKIEFVIPDIQLVDFKEALLFAFLGVLRYTNKINTLRAVTGARFDSVGGIIYYPR